MTKDLQALAIHSQESEQAVLGCILIDENVYDIVKDFIPESDVFYNLKNKQIWETMSELRKERIPVDAVNVCSKVKGEAIARALIVSSKLCFSRALQFIINPLFSKRDLRSLKINSKSVNFNSSCLSSRS